MDDLNLGVLIIGSIILRGPIHLGRDGQEPQFHYLNPELPPGGSSYARSHS